METLSRRKGILLEPARETACASMKSFHPGAIKEVRLTDGLWEKHWMFMSIYRGRELKGSVGSTLPILPLFGSAVEASRISFLRTGISPPWGETDRVLPRKRFPFSPSPSMHLSLSRSRWNLPWKAFTHGFRCLEQRGVTDGRLKVYIISGQPWSAGRERTGLCRFSEVHLCRSLQRGSSIQTGKRAMSGNEKEFSRE